MRGKGGGGGGGGGGIEHWPLLGTELIGWILGGHRSCPCYPLLGACSWTVHCPAVELFVRIGFELSLKINGLNRLGTGEEAVAEGKQQEGEKKRLKIDWN